MNAAIPGDKACDLARDQIFPASDNPKIASDAAYDILVSTNDADVKGSGAYEAVFNTCELGLVSWLAVPYDAKVPGLGATVVGTTSTETTNNWLACTTAAAGSSCSLSITTYVTGPIYAWVRLIDGNAGVGSYTLDGGTASTFSTATSPAMATQNGGNNSMGLIRIPGVAAGTHTFKMAQTSSSGTIGLIAVGAPPPTNSYSLPVVAVGETPFQSVAAPSQNGTTCVNGNDTICQAYIADIDADVALLAGDGLDVRVVKTRSYLFGTVAEMNDELHPELPSRPERA